MAFEDNIANDVRADIRELRTLAELYRIQQRVVELGVLPGGQRPGDAARPARPPGAADRRRQRRRPDPAGARRPEQPAAGPERRCTRSGSNYLTARMNLYLDLELMQLDDRGVWCDEQLQPNRPPRPTRPDDRPAGERLPAPRPVGARRPVSRAALPVPPGARRPARRRSAVWRRRARWPSSAGGRRRASSSPAAGDRADVLLHKVKQRAAQRHRHREGARSSRPTTATSSARCGPAPRASPPPSTGSSTTAPGSSRPAAHDPRRLRPEGPGRTTRTSRSRQA